MKAHTHTIRFGLYMFLSIAALFFVMVLMGWEHITELRLLNILFAAWFSNRLALNNCIDNDKIDYPTNLISVFGANLIAVVLSCAGLIFYVKVIDPSLIESLENGLFWGEHLNLPRIITALFMEGMAGSIIVSFAVMQYYKDYKRTTKKFDWEKTDG